MLIELILFASVVFMIAASVADMRTGEIPEKISYGFIITALLIAGVYSFKYGNYSALINSFIVGLGFFLFGLALFLLGQWGGGDVKLVGGIGCAIGFLHSVGYLTDNFFPYYTTYFIDLVCIALPYATIYGIFLGVKNPETWKEFVGYFSDIKTKLVIVLSFVPSLLGLILHFQLLFYFYLLIPVMLLVALYLKAVEMKALQELVSVNNLRLGDVVADDLCVDGKKIASKRDIEGFDEDALRLIRNLAAEDKISQKIKIKRGIKFAPVLFFAMVSVFWIGNFIEIAIRMLAGG